ncbi:MAG: hypothetical protein FWD63_03025 [Propionibacteriaceae bacterium]|nr:hypothetical protein [Propionibacteriaceae bacterium]
MAPDNAKAPRPTRPATVRALLVCVIVAVVVIVLAVLMVKPWAGRIDQPVWTPGVPTMSEARNQPTVVDAPGLPGARAYGGTNDDKFAGVTIGPDGSVAAVGRTYSADGDFPQRFSFHNSATMVMVHPDDTAWAQSYGGGGGDMFSASTIEPDGSVVVAGQAWSEFGDFPPTVIGGYALIAMIHPDGTLAWYKRFGTGLNGFTAVAVGPDGQIVASGYTDRPDPDLGCTSDRGCRIMAEMTPDGKVAWTKSFPNSQSFSAVAFTPEGNIATVGSIDADSCPQATDLPCSFVAALDTTGSLLWTKVFDVNTLEDWNGIVVAPDGSIVAVGATRSLFGNKAIAIKLTAEGALEWSKTYPIWVSTGFEAAGVNADSSIVAVGYSSTYVSIIGGAPSISNGLAALISADGTLVWSKTYGKSDGTEFTCVAVSPDQIAIAGHTTSPDFSGTHGTTNDDALLVRLTPDQQLN